MPGWRGGERGKRRVISRVIAPRDMTGTREQTEALVRGKAEDVGG